MLEIVCCFKWYPLLLQQISVSAVSFVRLQTSSGRLNISNKPGVRERRGIHTNLKDGLLKFLAILRTSNVASNITHRFPFDSIGILRANFLSSLNSRNSPTNRKQPNVKDFDSMCVHCLRSSKLKHLTSKFPSAT